MIKMPRLQVLFFVALISINGVCFAQDMESVAQQIRSLYEPISSLGFVAESIDAERKLIIAASADGRFSFVQFDKQMFSNTYKSDRDREQEWKVVPAHFNYYDGKLGVISSAPFDSARMFIENKLDKQMPIGMAIQVKHCIWPIMPILLDQGELSTQNEQFVLSVEQLDLRVYMNSKYQVVKVNWGESQNPENPLASFRFSNFEDANNPLFPTQMARAFGASQPGSADGEIAHEHYALQFVQDQDEVAKLLAFIDDSGEYVKQDAATSNVYDADGNFLYNEKEMEKEYLAAINNNGPSQIRYVLLISVALLTLGSAWILKSKKASA